MARPSTGQVLERKTSSGRRFALRFRAYGQPLSDPRRHHPDGGRGRTGERARGRPPRNLEADRGPVIPEASPSLPPASCSRPAPPGRRPGRASPRRSSATPSTAPTRPGKRLGGRRSPGRPATTCGGVLRVGVRRRCEPGRRTRTHLRGPLAGGVRQGRRRCHAGPWATRWRGSSEAVNRHQWAPAA